MTTLSPIQATIAELAAATAVCAIVGVDTIGVRRVRAVEPGPGDELGAGHYIPFIVVSTLDAPWHSGTATSVVTIGIKAYESTYPKAEALALVCAAVFHRKGARVATSRLGIYSSYVEGGPQLDKDPDTSQPLAHLIVTLNTSILPIPA